MEASQLRLTIPDAVDITRLMGPADALLRRIEAATSADITVRGQTVNIMGDLSEANRVAQVLGALMGIVERGMTPTAQDVDRMLALPEALVEAADDDVLGTFRGHVVGAKTPGQQAYVRAMRSSTITFATGPAGTGKTYLAMAMAVLALRRKEVGRIVLTRPVVEAGESLGFLPGTLDEKLDPYIRPLYDALFDLCERERANEYIEQGSIEIAPLAFMRGRTLNDAFVILDEAQNTTPEQMKMFLTRLGFRSTFVVTGDGTQRDLLGRNGLESARSVLAGIDGITFVDLGREDVVRHDLVGKIVDAYEAAESAAGARASGSGEDA